MVEAQCAADVLMIRPANFCANEQTAASNRFQNTSVSLSDAQANAAAEFDRLAAALDRAGVRTHVFQDRADPITPDALFPNNWLSFHADGSTVLYPMLAPNRRLERREDILTSLSKSHGFRSNKVIDLTQSEAEGHFLEGTGSLVLDREHRVAFAALSPRTSLDVLGEFAQRLDYDLVTFDTADRTGVPIYHTNVVMSIGRKFSVVCGAALREDQRDGVFAALKATGHDVIDISYEQLESFAGNMLELATSRGDHVVAMSKKAAESLQQAQYETLERLAGKVIPASIPTIEMLGGGSVRCMLAEIHLPRAVAA